MKINPTLYGIVVVVVFLGIILGFQSAGIWSISGKVDGQGKAVQPIEGDPSSIKGWMTLQQVSDSFDVPVAELLLAFDLPAETPAETPLKELESETFSVIGLRTWLGNR